MLTELLLSRWFNYSICQKLDTNLDGGREEESQNQNKVLLNNAACVAWRNNVQT